uniref:DnaJ homolog subfamily A member 3, mitochondrial (inferred by orthology to a human protein) n=1 Tax=Strongyloides venezuelensis TaxID=75913 RepID=A0A0K0FG79_STRVS
MLRRIEVRNIRYLSWSPCLFKDHYETLGVKKDASRDDIKKAFYALSKKHHPDMNPENQKEAVEKFQMIKKAYEILSNDFSRREYDETIRGPSQGYSGVTSERFGQNRRNYTDLDIDLKDFESFQRAARSRRGYHEKFDMPDEFFAKFGGKTFKSNYGEDEIPFVLNYKDKEAAIREAEELKILKEIEEEKAKSRYPLPTFEQLLQQQEQKKQKERLKYNLFAFSVVGTVLCGVIYSRFLR